MSLPGKSVGIGSVYLVLNLIWLSFIILLAGLSTALPRE